jgi:hypothetical protein
VRDALASASVETNRLLIVGFNPVCSAFFFCRVGSIHADLSSLPNNDDQTTTVTVTTIIVLQIIEQNVMRKKIRLDAPSLFK